MNASTNIDVVIGAYGYAFHNMIMSKATAMKWAEEQVGNTLNPVLFPELGMNRYRVARVYASPSPDPTKGQIMAECQLMSAHAAQGMEVK